MISNLKQKISEKIQKIMSEGVRLNTHAPVSSTNKRVKVPVKRAVAIANRMVRKGKK